MVKSLNKLVREHKEGIPEIDLAPIDPLRFQNVFLSQGGNLPLTMDLSIPIGDVLGFGGMVFNKMV